MIVRKYLYPIAIIVLIVFNLYMSVKYKRTIIKTTNLIEELRYNNENHEFIISSLRKNRKIFYSNEDTKVTNLSISDIKGNMYKLKEIVTNDKYLVLYFDENACSLCVEKELELMKQYFYDVKERIIILTNFKNYKDYFNFIETNKIDFKIFNMNNKKLGYKIENVSLPYVFILDPSMKAEYFFIPDKNLKGWSDDYYEAIYKRFF